ncbi:ATP-binding cassette domain-containing protein [uncultured Brachyspira sp.]|uniref:methionine ABC transporter ATP-binding protein n=1 Tax=uncultured Brachyspira sp. TaxID=221953 RepID=UPI002637C8F6|nr:ATP-binding cassette domain-containing protein [uncultured Brachyspira sp.]
MIKIAALKKQYNNIEILKGIDLDIDKGKIFGIIGRSGAGKSTLLRCINGLEKYDSGYLEVNGIDIKKLNEKELRMFRRDVGMIFQHFSLITRASVYDNIAFPMQCWHYNKKEIDERVRYLIDVVGMYEKINNLARDLSGGQKQRVAIARALSMNPKILLSDEATSALDPKNSEAIMELLNNINKSMGITIVLVTHQMNVVKSICDDMAIIEDGIVKDKGIVEEIFINQPASLINILGDNRILLPNSGKNIEIMYKKDDSNNIIEKLIRKFNVNIIDFIMEDYKNCIIGKVIINVINSNDLKKVEEYLKSINIENYKVLGE